MKLPSVSADRSAVKTVVVNAVPSSVIVPPEATMLSCVVNAVDKTLVAKLIVSKPVTLAMSAATRPVLFSLVIVNVSPEPVPPVRVSAEVIESAPALTVIAPDAVDVYESVPVPVVMVIALVKPEPTTTVSLPVVTPVTAVIPAA